jgi:hypothetical protein
MMEHGQKIMYHRLGIFLILVLLTMACSLSVPGQTKATSPTAILSEPNAVSAIASIVTPTPVESSGQQPQGPALSVPTRDQIVKSLYANGFIDGDNDKHFKNDNLGLIAFLGNGCDVSILINVDANISREDQFLAVQNILTDLYPKDFVKYFNSYKIRLYENAVNGGTALSVKGQKSSGFMMTIGNPLYTPGVLVALFHPDGAFSNLIN